MGRKAFFLESKTEVFDYATCDKCGLKIKTVQDGKCFWNPNPKAVDRNICRNCYDVFRHEREEGWRRWQEKHAALEHAAYSVPCRLEAEKVENKGLDRSVIHT